MFLSAVLVSRLPQDKGATYVRQGGHHVGHWPTLLVLLSFPRLISAVGDWMSTILPHMLGLSANLECRSEMCSRWLAENTGCKKSLSGHRRTTLSGYIFATKALIDNRKKMLSSNISSACPHNTVIFGPLAAEIGWRVWGTPPNFNGFRVLATLLHGTPVVNVSQTLRR